ncbi:MAG: (2Fe-2S)-binding protein [Pseudomonadota bacterium]
MGINTIARAVEDQGLLSVDDIGSALRAGTNCGSCKPELARLLKSLTLPQAAQ